MADPTVVSDVAKVDLAVKGLVTTLHLYGHSGSPRQLRNGLWEALRILSPEMCGLTAEDASKAYETVLTRPLRRSETDIAREVYASQEKQTQTGKAGPSLIFEPATRALFPPEDECEP